MKLLSERGKRSFITSKTANFVFMVMLFSVVMFCLPVFADNQAAAAGNTSALDSAKNLLSKAATAGGGLWAVWGLVQLGISIKDHNGPGIQGAIWQLIGGAIIIAAASVIAGLDLSMT